MKMPNDLAYLQIEHEEWTRRNFPHQTSEEVLIGIVEEVGELAHAVLKHNQELLTDAEYRDLAKDAIGDIALFLIGYCGIERWFFEAILEETWSKVKKRSYTSVS